MIDYEQVKKFFGEKLISDSEGFGRFESAFYHTMEMVYHQGVEDGMATCYDPCQQDVYVGIKK